MRRIHLCCFISLLLLVSCHNNIEEQIGELTLIGVLDSIWCPYTDYRDLPTGEKWAPTILTRDSVEYILHPGLYVGSPDIIYNPHFDKEPIISITSSYTATEELNIYEGDTIQIVGTALKRYFSKNNSRIYKKGYYYFVNSNVHASMGADPGLILINRGDKYKKWTENRNTYKLRL